MLNYLLSLLLLSVLSALVGFGFQRMMDEKMIFEWYREWLEGMSYRSNKNYDLMNSNSKMLIQSKFLYYLSKPLGLCIVCNTTWIGIVITLLILNIHNWSIIINCIIVGVNSASIVILINNWYLKLQRS